MASSVVAVKSVALFAAVAPILAFAAEPTWHVSTTTYKDYGPGFRCAFWGPKDGRDTPGLLFQADDETVTDRRALIGIDGTPLLLSGVDLRVKNKRRDLYSIGDSLFERFEGKGVTAVVDATVTGACPANAESCEVTKYRAKLTVTKDGSSRVLEVVGECGS